MYQAKFTRLFIAGLMFTFALALSSCATSSAGQSGQRSATAGKVQFCKRGDQQVASSSQCLQDDAACYELSNGKWCTGERGNTCPSGSVEIQKGRVCPAGARCIDYGESLKCAIQFR